MANFRIYVGGIKSVLIEEPEISEDLCGTRFISLIKVPFGHDITLEFTMSKGNNYLAVLDTGNGDVIIPSPHNFVSTKYCKLTVYIRNTALVEDLSVDVDLTNNTNSDTYQRTYEIESTGSVC